MSYKQIVRASNKSLRARLAFLADLATKGELDEGGQEEFDLIENELLSRNHLI